MAKDDCGFSEREYVRDNLKVVWEYIGEGWCEDYRPDDPADTPLLRFSCYVKDGLDGEEWVELPDASYCTRMPIDSRPEWLERGAELILDAIEHESYRRRLEELSWLQPMDFTQEGR